QFANGLFQGCTTITTALAQDLYVHPDQYYVNVHTATFPGGEIRGQLSLSSPWGSRGDANADGDLTAVDALCILRSVAGLVATATCPVLPLAPPTVADVNGDGQGNAVDALCILRAVAALAATANCPSLGP